MLENLKKEEIVSFSEGYILYGGMENESNYFVFNTSTGKIFKLNRVSYLMLSSLDGSRTIVEALDRITRLFDCEIKEVESDFANLISSLLDKGIIKYHSK